MAVSALSGFAQVAMNWNLQENLPASGLNLPAVQNSSAFNFKIPYSTGGNVANGANEFIGMFQAIAASGSATIDLTNLTDILQYTAVNLARFKGILFCLLSPTQDTTNGTLASSVTIGNAASNANLMFMNSTTPTFKLNNGDFIEYATGIAAGIVVDSTHKSLKILNNDAVLAAIFGSTT